MSNIRLKNSYFSQSLQTQGVSEVHNISHQTETIIDCDLFTNAQFSYFHEHAPINSEAFQLENPDRLDDSIKPAGLVKASLKNHSKLKPFYVPKFHDDKKLKKVVFLDRDGILIEDTAYPHGKNVKCLQTHIAYLQAKKNQGYEFIVITNQSGIGRGYFEEDQYLLTNQVIEKYLESFDLKILDWFYCPFHTDGIGKYKRNSFLRKPMPGMVLKACENYHIDLAQSIMIGDKQSDRLNIHLQEFRIFL